MRPDNPSSAVVPATPPDAGRVVWQTAYAAREAFMTSRKRDAHMDQFRGRIRWLKSLKDLIRHHKSYILHAVSKERGVSEHAILLNEYIPAVALLDHYIRIAIETLGDEDRSRGLSLSFGNKRVIVRKEPLGVVGVISPFNYPFSLPLGPIVSALISGNAVLWKPSEVTPNTSDLLYTILQKSFAATRSISSAMLVRLPVDASYGEALVNCPLVLKIHFTGSVAVGSRIEEINTAVRKKNPRRQGPTLELGGSNAAIVLDDADLQEAADVITWSRCSNGGQSCNAIKRVFVTERVYEQFIMILAHRMGAVQDHETKRMFTEREEGSFMRFFTNAAGCGARIFHPSPANEHLDGMPLPTLACFDSYNPEADILVEEVFLPMLAVVRVHDQGEAVMLANRSQFGLGASVFTRDREKFRKIAAQLLCGAVNRNDAMTEFAQPQIPFGGIKNSGNGHVHGREGLLDFVWLKTIVDERWKAPKLQLYPWTEKKMRMMRRWVDVLLALS